jgi:cytochrome c oxidase subunit 2
VRIDLAKFWVTVALAGVLAVATVSEFRSPPPAASGNSMMPGTLLFQAKGCSGCHSISGVAEIASIGPNLTQLATVAGQRIPGFTDVAYVTQSIRAPGAYTVNGFGSGVMPTFKLSDDEVEGLVAFLLTER